MVTLGQRVKIDAVSSLKFYITEYSVLGIMCLFAPLTCRIVLRWFKQFFSLPVFLSQTALSLPFIFLLGHLCGCRELMGIVMCGWQWASRLRGDGQWWLLEKLSLIGRDSCDTAVCCGNMNPKLTGIFMCFLRERGNVLKNYFQFCEIFQFCF